MLKRNRSLIYVLSSLATVATLGACNNDLIATGPSAGGGRAALNGLLLPSSMPTRGPVLNFRSRGSIAPLTGSIDFLTADMVQKAYPYYNRPYPSAPDTYVEKNGITVYRPNHGIAHSVRKAALTNDIVDTLLAQSGDGELKGWLAAKIAQDATYPQKIALLGLLSRSGREDESDDVTAEKRHREMVNGARNYAEVATASGMVYASGELEDFEQAIILDGSSGENADQTNLSRIHHCAHMIELLRMGRDEESSARSDVPELTEADMDALYSRDHEYLNATGDLRYEHRGYASQFYTLSTDPVALWTTVNGLRTKN